MPGRTIATALATTILFISALFVAGPANAQTYAEKILHTFKPVTDNDTLTNDGLDPLGNLVLDPQGNLYGVTFEGGTGACTGAVAGCGTVFKIDPSGNETVVHSFGNRDGIQPFSQTLLRDAQGNLYGTTESNWSQMQQTAQGTVFKIDAAGNETVLLTFASFQQGAAPTAGLVADPQGNLYGTTYEGGVLCGPSPSVGCGTVFKLDPNGNETVLYSFTGSNGDGAQPSGSLVRDSSGNLYGTTTSGGSGTCTAGTQVGCGTVFKIDASGQETVLYSFTGVNGDGADPIGDLLMDAQGNLYGVTNVGGPGPCTIGTLPGCGTVFKVDPTGRETVLYSFAGGADGEFPGGLMRDSLGNLYGMTYRGGGSANCTFNNAPTGCGIVFKLDASGKESVLYAFTETGGDGALPESGVIQDAEGNLYGVTSAGGGSNAEGIASTAYGIVFELQISTGFTLGGSTSAVSVSPGATTNNTATVTVTPTGGFTGSVALTAAITSSPTGAQDLPTLSFGSTSPVTINGTTAETATLTIFTTAPAIAGLADPARPGIRWYNAGGAAMMAFALFLGIPERARRWRAKLVLLLVLAAFVGGLPACGGSSNGGGGGVGNPGTTPGAYTVTVTATSGNTMTSSTITLTVQ